MFWEFHFYVRRPLVQSHYQATIKQMFISFNTGLRIDSDGFHIRFEFICYFIFAVFVIALGRTTTRTRIFTTRIGDHFTIRKCPIQCFPQLAFQLLYPVYPAAIFLPACFLLSISSVVFKLEHLYDVFDFVGMTDIVLVFFYGN